MVASATVTKYVVTVDYKDLRGFMKGLDVTSDIAEATTYDTKDDAEKIAFIIKVILLESLPDVRTGVLPRTIFE